MKTWSAEFSQLSALIGQLPALDVSIIIIATEYVIGSKLHVYSMQLAANCMAIYTMLKLRGLNLDTVASATVLSTSIYIYTSPLHRAIRISQCSQSGRFSQIRSRI